MHEMHVYVCRKRHPTSKPKPCHGHPCAMYQYNGRYGGSEEVWELQTGQLMAKPNRREVTENDPSIFAKVISELYSLLQDSFLRFIATDAFIQLETIVDDP